MEKLKKGDTVQINKGKDRGKKGKLLKIFKEKNRATVEGLNLIKKHRRQTRQDQQGGIVSIEAAVSMSNLMLVCKNCNKPARVGFKVASKGEKSRYCKSCNEVL